MNKYLLLTLLILVSLWSFSSKSLTPVKSITLTATSTGAVIGATTPTTLATSTTATTTPIKKPETKTATTTKQTKKEEPVKPLPLPTPPEPAPDFVAINEFARKAVVNILCTTKGGELSPISGTGVVITPDGIVLTNAHIGQYFLLKDYRQKDFIECVARTGSPAYPRYRLELVYISPTWVANNKAILKQQDPKGNGENDFAFLRITEMIDGSNLPKSFDYVISNIREIINIGEPVILVSYPAGFLGGLSILQGLSVASAVTTIQDIFTYSERFVDLISVGGTILSQKGASGGAVVDKHNSLLGIISTASESPTTGARDLRAITLAYVNRDLQTEQNVTLDNFLFQDLKEFGKNFRETVAPGLTKTIVDAITITN